MDDQTIKKIEMLGNALEKRSDLLGSGARLVTAFRKVSKIDVNADLIRKLKREICEGGTGNEQAFLGIAERAEWAAHNLFEETAGKRELLLESAQKIRQHATGEAANLNTSAANSYRVISPIKQACERVDHWVKERLGHYDL